MIQAFSWNTPNGQKLHIMLEETELPYQLVPVNIGEDEQHQERFLKINPNGKIPAILDTDGPDGTPLALMESGAILTYLAEKSGKFMPQDPRAQHAVREWLFCQVGHVGPMFGQAHHFDVFAKERIEYAIKRYSDESKRLMRVLDRRLGEVEYLAGGEYSIADIATFPWIRSGATGVKIAEYKNVERWFQAIEKRPAVVEGLRWFEDKNLGALEGEAHAHFFERGSSR
jgi:GSH-dependent disulfide-bond oxidoreductase